MNKSGAIFRFSAKNALFVLSPFNPIRRLAVFILTHPYPFLLLWKQIFAIVAFTCYKLNLKITIFSALVMLTILANCVVMTIKHPPEFVESVFYAKCWNIT